MIGPLVRRDVFPTARPLYATCDAGLEDLLAAEIRALGVTEVHPGHRGVGFMGDREVLWRANLCLRVANRVLVPLAEFDAADRDALYAGAAAVEWSDWFESKRTIVVDASCHASAIDHTAFASLVVKDAVCDHFRELEGRRPSVDKRRADVPINVRLDHDHCVISLDSSGSRLYRRGYRTEAGRAPLKETLAAAILMMSGWTPEQPLVDPMCGAGTFVLEAGMMARNIPPGLHRLGKRGEGFAFQNWSTHRAAAFERVVRALRDDIEDSLLQPIEGGDLDDQALELARRNAKRCGLADDVTLFRRPLGEAVPPEGAPAGVVVVNPPYGKRLRPGDLDGLYKALGYTLKRRFAGWTAHVLVGNEAPAHRIGLRPSGKIPLRNGPIDCTVLTFDLFAGRGPVDADAWDKHEGDRPARPRRDDRDDRPARPRRDDRDDRPRGDRPRGDRDDRPARPRRDDRDDRPRGDRPRRTTGTTGRAQRPARAGMTRTTARAATGQRGRGATTGTTARRGLGGTIATSGRGGTIGRSAARRPAAPGRPGRSAARRPAAQRSAAQGRPGRSAARRPTAQRPAAAGRPGRPAAGERATAAAIRTTGRAAAARDDQDDRPRGDRPRAAADDQDDRPRGDRPARPRRDDRDDRPPRPRRDDRDERPRRDDRDDRPRADRPRPPAGRTPGDKPPPRGRPANVVPPRKHRPKRDQDRED
ncbi:MAG: hypothetical protein H6704_25015 [Myxococcales bacterium]|nr:hypothetical protein [Myxococcales bacterium]